ncbi:MAG: 3-methyl-2-oxobutanoate hydroxymethyltransferase [Clostridia bacterium]|nr:3-methyl-2-oxobutanoate hydroxymethyltransferase [Clostridia bacterium]
MERKKITIPDVQDMKARGKKITMITAYDYPSARLADQAGMDMLLVGDSVGMVVMGLKDTIPVSMEAMIHHTQAVARGTQYALVVADLPFLSYQVSREEAVLNAGRLIKEGGADAVKLEGGRAFRDVVKAMVDAGIPVMGHLGLTPQFAMQLGGFKVQGRSEEAAAIILEDAKILEEAGAFSVVLECVPASVGKKVTASLSIPTIGIGAGPDCDGQVLVYHDVVGLFDRFVPKFVKRYINLSPMILEALKKYREEVESGVFPSEEHIFK